MQHPQLISHKRPSALINSNDEETNRYIHEENWVECQSFSPWSNCRTHERICSPWTPGQSHTYHYKLENHIVLQHADESSNVQRKKAVTQKAQTLEENYVSTLDKTLKTHFWVTLFFFFSIFLYLIWGWGEGEEQGEEALKVLTNSSTFNVKITAPAARRANATANTSDWRNQHYQKKY